MMMQRTVSVRPATNVRAGTKTPSVIVSIFEVGKHLVRVSGANGRWTVALDERVLDTWYMTRAEAWEAGVREADALDRLAPN